MTHPLSALRTAATAALLALTTNGMALAQNGLPLLPLTYTHAFDAIGRIGDDPTFVASQGCTGTLIAPDLVLTAGHCLREEGGGGAVFVPGWRAGVPPAPIAITTTLRPPNYAFEGPQGPQHDLGLAVLATPVPDIPPLALADAPGTAFFGQPVALLGYHAGAPGGLTGSFACPLGPGPVARGFAPRSKMGVTCPVLGGNSGSPLLIQTEAGWQIVGVASTRAGDARALAEALSPWLRAAVDAHLNGTPPVQSDGG